MVSAIPNVVKRLWDKWDTRCVILSSLSLQIILILVAPFRKSTSRSLVVWFLWSAYLLADCAANFCIGLISNRKDTSSSTTTDVNDYIMAFWAPFLLVHLGGPDTITAFSLEDNELWLRHMLGVIFQVSVAVYTFLLTVPGNTLWIPTLLVFIAGIIKYTEKTRALYLGSMGTFRQSMFQDAEAGPNYAKLMDVYLAKTEAGLPARLEVVKESEIRRRNIKVENSARKKDLEFKIVQDGYYFFNKFKGLIVDMVYSMGDRDESRKYFVEDICRTSVDNKTDADSECAVYALRILEVELNFMYEFFYTKASVLHNTKGFVFRLVAFCSMGTALVLFVLEEKRGFDQFDVRVTYALLYGALALDSLALLMRLFSDRTVVSSQNSHKGSPKVVNMIRDFKLNILNQLLCLNRYFLGRKKPKWSEKKAFSTPFLFRRWSRTISGLNLITHCLRRCPKHTSEIDSSGSSNAKAILPVRWFKAMQFLKDVWDGCIEYFGLRDMLDKWLFKESNPVPEELWKLIFNELKRKAETAEDLYMTKKICAARGEWVLKEAHLDVANKLLPYVTVDKVSFDESLVQWHIATHLCCCDSDDHQCKLSRLLSDYMLYLLVMEPGVMSGVAGIGLKRYRDTCAEAIRFFSKRDEPDEVRKISNNISNISKEEIAACETLLGVPTILEPIQLKGTRSKSVLFDGCILAKILMQQLPKDQRWDIINKIWVELLSFAASNCRPPALVNQLSKGGELICLVWLLMVQMGLGMQFQITEASTKLICDS